ncbi:MAG: DUF3567 domain-containing protein [Lautropia sp.]|nr:DUF3567 domain-containing protein [Lautropia sp.]
MNMIYNSPNYCIVEFNGEQPDRVCRGYEIMDKASKREIFIGGLMADKFRQDVSILIAAEPSIEEVDQFLSGFEGLMHQPLLLH